MTVSVVIPSYNRVSTLPRAIDSVLSQTLSPDEIHVVDDGSSDETRALLETHYRDTVVYHYQSQQGVSAARNTGIRASQADWIALLDSDDCWHPKKLDKQVTALLQAPAYNICHTDERWFRNNVRVNPHKKHAKSGGDLFERSLHQCCISPSTVIIKRTLFDAVGLFDESLPACEDYDLWLRITRVEPVLYVDEQLISRYAGHADQLSQQHWGMDRFRVKSLINLLNSETLAFTQQGLVKNILITKLTILLQGAEKRAKHDEIRYYRSLLVRWAG